MPRCCFDTGLIASYRDRHANFNTIDAEDVVYQDVNDITVAHEEQSSKHGLEECEVDTFYGSDIAIVP